MCSLAIFRYWCTDSCGSDCLTSCCSCCCDPEDRKRSRRGSRREDEEICLELRIDYDEGWAKIPSGEKALMRTRHRLKRTIEKSVTPMQYWAIGWSLPLLLWLNAADGQDEIGYDV